MNDPSCKCFHHSIVPLCIVLIGLAFLLKSLGLVSTMFVNYTWPILLILIGLTKMCKSMCGCCGMKK